MQALFYTDEQGTPIFCGDKKDKELIAEAFWIAAADAVSEKKKYGTITFETLVKHYSLYEACSYCEDSQGGYAAADEFLRKFTAPEKNH
ncbi:MAG: hypothetical protein FWE93_04330 [Alphaproteobacteria bacterium]|nr:hypothetical protein [Alphaproteobacteria bacterium]